MRFDSLGHQLITGIQVTNLNSMAPGAREMASSPAEGGSNGQGFPPAPAAPYRYFNRRIGPSASDLSFNMSSGGRPYSAHYRGAHSHTLPPGIDPDMSFGRVSRSVPVAAGVGRAPHPIIPTPEGNNLQVLRRPNEYYIRRSEDGHFPAGISSSRQLTSPGENDILTHHV